MDQRRNYIPDGYLNNALGIDPLHHIEEPEDVDIKVQKNIQEIPKAEEERIRQTSRYSEGDRVRINNNHFFEERSNPLSSKGN